MDANDLYAPLFSWNAARPEPARERATAPPPAEAAAISPEDYAALLARAQAAEADAANLRRALDAAFGEEPGDTLSPDGQVVQIVVNARRLGEGYEVDMPYSRYPLFIPGMHVRAWRPLWASCRNAAEQHYRTVLFPDASENKDGIG